MNPTSSITPLALLQYDEPREVLSDPDVTLLTEVAPHRVSFALSCRRPDLVRGKELEIYHRRSVDG